MRGSQRCSTRNVRSTRCVDVDVLLYAFRQDLAEHDVADAYLAAYAAERIATWLSADRGFARFPDLRWRHPTSLIT